MESFGRAAPVQRGCGKRKTGVYIELGVGPGKPIDAYLYDPPEPIARELDLVNKSQLLPRIAMRRDEMGGGETRVEVLDLRTGLPIYDLYIWIGMGTNHKPLYPYTPDFIEEAARFGISRHVSSHLDFTKLTRESMMILAHPRAINRSWQDQRPPATCEKHLMGHDTETMRKGPCIYKNWDLIPEEAAARPEATIRLPGDTICIRELGDTSYTYHPTGEEVEWQPGYIMKAPISGIALVQQEKGDAHTKTREMLAKALEDRPDSALPFYDTRE